MTPRIVPETIAYVSHRSEPARFGSIIGISPQVQSVRSLITRLAATRYPLLILGETGTGKGLVAREVHARSPWSNHPFISINCSALTPTLIESELFGHVRGAFTGATEGRQGLLMAAGGGTVFLDEIADLPVELQAKLLSVLEEAEVRPVGSNRPVRLEARIVAATNHDLEADMRQGVFRKDLYFRLNVLSIMLPPLRDRKSDIPVLVGHFLEQDSGVESNMLGISRDAMRCLTEYDWPGNVRELHNCVQRLLALGAGPEIQVNDLPPEVLYHVTSVADPQKQTTLQELERRAILDALEAVGGDCIRAAKLLGIGKTTLYRKLKEYSPNRRARAFCKESRAPSEAADAAP